MAIDNPLYLAYCSVHGRPDPEAMLEHDRKQWPGGCMCGYILWVAQSRRAYAATHQLSNDLDWYDHEVKHPGAWLAWTATAPPLTTTPKDTP